MPRLAPAALAAAILLAGCSASTPQPSTPGDSVTTPTASAIATATSPSATAPAASQVLWPDNSTVSHIFFHSLIIDPDRAFSKANPDAAGNAEYMVTKVEFDKILQSLYERDYVLVHPHRLAAMDASGVMRWTPLYLPPGKKPLIISVDDVSYNTQTIGWGFADRLTLDADGHVTNDYTDAAGVTTQGAYDVPTVMDAFVAQHPDFSYDGDKGTIALTGYEGVLGYRSSTRVYGDTEKTRADIAKAKAVADALRATGWRFACHSYGHRNFTTSTVAEIKTDITKWKNEVEPIVGKTDMMVYAFGADISDVARYTNTNAKYAYLNGQQGFDFFFNVDGSAPHWYQLQPGSLRGNRINIDGITLSRALKGNQKVLPLFFDAKEVRDPKHPMPAA